MPSYGKSLSDCSHNTTVVLETSQSLNLKDHYRVVMLGGSQVGKTAIIHQFLYERFPIDYKATVEEFHCNTYDATEGGPVTLEILDTSGSDEFPAMRRLAISGGDAFVLVYAVDDLRSFEEVRRLRDLLLELRPRGAPIVVVGNKADVSVDRRVVRKEVAEGISTIDWENGFTECSAKDNAHIMDIFNELLTQARLPVDLLPSGERRRLSLPVFGTPNRVKDAVTPKRNSCAMS